MNRIEKIASFPTLTPHYKFRGFSEVWTRQHRANAMFTGRCIITPERIAVRAVRWQNVHQKAELVELRWNQWPLPGVVIITRTEAGHIWSSFGTGHSARLRTALATCGYTTTHWPSLRQWRTDLMRYALYEEK